MSVQRRLRQVHKIVGIAVGIQVFFWMLSGLYMTIVPIDIVRGEHVMAPPPAQALPRTSLYDVNKITATYPQATTVTLTYRLNQPAYRVVNGDAPVWVDALTGKPLARLSAQQAVTRVSRYYQGEHTVTDVRLITQREQAPETGGRRLPLWQVNMNDWQATSIYVAAMSGEVVAVRSQVWRWFDFMWMLHIMDYDARSDFNNPLVIFMASLGLLLTLSGLLLITNSVRKKGWQIIWR